MDLEWVTRRLPLNADAAEVAAIPHVYDTENQCRPCECPGNGHDSVGEHRGGYRLPIASKITSGSTGTATVRLGYGPHGRPAYPQSRLRLRHADLAE